jgi:5'-nucleotidase
MKLLISNDDGVFAAGIRALAETLAAAGHTVTVVCPDRERSATGHGLTLHDPIRAEPVQDLFASNIQVWACSGTPSDCVKLGLGGLLDQPPDFVLAGINHGPNLGTDILYSGTVSAAMEGLFEGIPSVALSLADYGSREFGAAAQFARQLLDRLAQEPPAAPMLLNVNVPAVPGDRLMGVQVARLAVRRYFDVFEKRIDPRGRNYYWLAGEVLEELDPDREGQATAAAAVPLNVPLNVPLDNVPLDVDVVRDRTISITPLRFNLTDHGNLAVWQECLGKMVLEA